eukprot:NODE_10802_length_191_cov_9.901408_g10719_i0.p1 GENE.NODE_10802_length_191_cov_9.901408_g10719_i0~~NODE_10802_length_191_cov_9.901408_g10719_i0.p1  ORF type:complete len:61 (+),score=15.77 NODE_10802_length_191_cov_9.901408_g10719_i0:22-183(+)
MGISRIRTMHRRQYIHTCFLSDLRPAVPKSKKKLFRESPNSHVRKQAPCTHNR